MLASASTTQVLADRLIAAFPLSLESASRIVGVPATEVELDISSRIVWVKVAGEPQSVLDLMPLHVEGELFPGRTFTSQLAARVEMAD